MTQLLSSGIKGDLGVAETQALVNRLDWIFRVQPTADVGIDGQIEPRLAGAPSGRLIGVQVKASKDAFRSRAKDGSGWTYRFSKKELRWRAYWLRYDLPVILVLYDVEARVAYWQAITPETAVLDGAGFIVFVPATQQINPECADQLALVARSPSADNFVALLNGLPDTCAAALARLEENDPVLARRLTQILLDGRDEPSVVVDELATDATVGCSAVALMAVADYANEYGLHQAAGLLYRASGDRDGDPDAAARLYAYAGLLAIPSDVSVAVELLQRATRSDQAALLSAIGCAYLEHGDMPGPVPIPDLLIERSDLVSIDPTALRFMAEQHGKAGDIRHAIEFHEKALALAPTSPRQQVAVAEALMRITEPTGGQFQMGHYARAADLAAEARDTLRRWRADSTDATQILIMVSELAGDTAASVRAATAAPAGDATEREAADPGVAFYGARNACAIGDLATADRLAMAIEASGDSRWMTLWRATRADACEAPAEERIALWRQVIDTDVQDGHLLSALNGLATLGQWPLVELDRLRESGMLTPGTYDLLRGHALRANGSPDAALSAYRKSSTRSDLGAQEHARHLARLSRFTEAVDACDTAAARFGDYRMSLLALDILNQAGQTAEALTRAQAVLAQPNYPFAVRHHIRGLILAAHISTGSWTECERVAREGIADAAEALRAAHHATATATARSPLAIINLRTAERDLAWVLITCQVSSGQVSHADETLAALHPEIANEHHFVVWSDLRRLYGWTPATVEQALSWIEQGIETPGLAGRILYSLRTSCQQQLDASPFESPGRLSAGPAPVIISDDLHKRLEAAWDRHAKSVRATGSTDDSLDSDELANLGAYLDMPTSTEGAWPTSAPIGTASTATVTPYGLSIYTKLVGVLPAVDGSHHDIELAAAAAAIGGTIVVETTSLYVLAALTGHWNDASTEFTSLVIPATAMRDVLASHVAARAMNTQNAVPVDTLRPRSTGTNNPHPATVFECSSHVLAAAQHCRVEPVESLDELAVPYDIDSCGAWLSPVALALKRGLPLLSDDRGLRRFARSRGVEAFGTLALLETIIKAGSLPDAVPGTILRQLFAASVVDLPDVWQLVVETAEDDAADTPRVLANISRADFWRSLDDEIFVPVIAKLTQIAACHTSTIEPVLSAMTTGLLALNPVAEMIAVVGALMLTAGTGVTTDAVALVLPILERLSAPFEIDPTDRVKQIVQQILTDPDEQFPMSAPEAASLIAAAFPLV